MILLTPEQKAYLASIIDGEGSISLVRINKNKHPAPMISIASTDRELLEWILKTTHTGRIIVKKNYNPSVHKESYALNITYLRAIEILRAITPYLVIKRKRKRTQYILDNYPSVTQRNGRYSPEQLITKENFYRTFMSL